MAEPCLPALPDVAEVHRRLLLVFPEGSPNRAYCTREMAARKVFAALYVGAVSGTDVWLAPKHVYRMTEEQAAQTQPAARESYVHAAMRPGYDPAGTRWYADNTREPIRDETLRERLFRPRRSRLPQDLPQSGLGQLRLVRLGARQASGAARRRGRAGRPVALRPVRAGFAEGLPRGISQARRWRRAWRRRCSPKGAGGRELPAPSVTAARCQDGRCLRL